MVAANRTTGGEQLVTSATRLAVYAAGLLVVFAGMVGLGRLAGPVSTAATSPAEHGSASGAHRPQAGAHAGLAGGVPGGLQVAQDGFRLQPLTAGLAVGVPAEFAFRIVDAAGAPVTGYTPTHERDLHLIVVRRDLSGFQHVHPSLGADGVWRIPLAVGAPGQYRVFGDFRPASRAKPVTLGVDLPAAGDYVPVPLPAPARTASVDGYTVELAGDLTAGAASGLMLRISRDGRPVSDLQPYLGAYGHLVALRDGDLAYLHVHPGGAPGDGRTAAGPEVAFHAEVPSAGAYRLYLDFQHAGRVHTAEFTAIATERGAAQPTGTGPGAGHDAGHGEHN
jgi:hypothetical protein